MSSGADINLPAILFEPSPSPNPRRRPLIFDPAGLSVEAVSARLLRVFWNYPADRFEAAQAQAFDGCVWLRVAIDNELFILGQVIWQPVGEVMLAVPHSEGSYRIDLGLYRHAGDWFPVVRSNPVQTPSDAIEAAIPATRGSAAKLDLSEAPVSRAAPTSQYNGAATEQSTGVDSLNLSGETARNGEFHPPLSPVRETLTRDGEPARTRDLESPPTNLRELVPNGAEAFDEQALTSNSKPTLNDGDRRDRNLAEWTAPASEASLSGPGAGDTVQGSDVGTGSSHSFSTASSWSGASTANKRGFRLGMDLVLYGNADSADSLLTIAGQPVEVRADGSFSFRIALPDGRFELPVACASNGEPWIIQTVVEIARILQSQPSNSIVEIL